MRNRSLWSRLGVAALAIVLAAQSRASADTPRPAGDAKPAPAAKGTASERELIAGLRTNAPEVSDPEFLRVAGFVHLGAGFLSGQTRRDAPAADGSQVSLRNELDLESPELTGRLGLQFRPADDWRLFVAFSSGRWSGAHVQDGISATTGLPEQFVFDGVLFSGEPIAAELDLLRADIGALAVMHDLDPGRFEFGIGASWWKSELEIRSRATPSKRALEQTESGTPWVGTRIVMSDLGLGHMEFAARLGLFWAGDNATYHVNALFHVWYGIGYQLGPFLLTARIEYEWWETHQHANSQDEVFGISLLTTTVGFAVRF